MLRDGVALPPTLHGRVIAMAQGTSQRTDTATLCDDGLMASHERNVRYDRTSVNNVDNVRSKFDTERMAIQKTGEALLALKRRAGMSLEAIAAAAGYKGRSSVQNFFSPAFEKPLEMEAAHKLASAFEGKGSPPISRNEVMALTGAFDTNAIPVQYEGASEQRMRQDIPILGTALGADRVAGELAIEQTCLYEQEHIGFAKRPVVLDGRVDVYGLYVQGSSMDPAYEDGALILAETKRPPRVGEYAVVYLRMNGECDETDADGRSRTIMVKKLIRKSASYYEFEQFNPRITFRVESAEVLKMHRVIPWGELLS